MRFIVEYLIMVYVDMIGAILLSDNILVSQHTKHIDIRHYFIWVCVEKGTVKTKLISIYNTPPRIPVYQEPK